MRQLIPLLLVFAGLTVTAPSQEVSVQPKGKDPFPIQQGKIRKIDAKNKMVTVTADGKDLDAVVVDDTRFMGSNGQFVKDGLSDPQFKVGADVMFKIANRDGKAVLIGMRIRPMAGPEGGKLKEAIKVDTSGLKPLTEMGAEKYHGFMGGLYPGGQNQRPADHDRAGLAIARTVQPLDAMGKPDPSGKIVLITVGMSNTSQVSTVFKKIADADAARNPKLVIVNGAQGGLTAVRIQDPESNIGSQYWAELDKRLEQAGVTRAQVQAVWIKEADGMPTEGFPKYAQKLQAELANIVRILPRRYPNVKLAYLSSRTYGGYAKTRLNPDPYALESGFSVKWLIEQQLQGDKSLNYDPARGAVTAPWLSWGPYFWANGTTKRADGFHYVESDFGADGTHPSPQGQQKIAAELLRFFKTDTTTKGWFLR